MNSSELKLTIIRQVDSLEENVLIEVLDYIKRKVNYQYSSVANTLSVEQQQALLQAQQSIQDGKGIPHQEIVSKYKKIYDIS
jgi:hypothetical protein